MAFKKHADCFQQNTSIILSHVDTRNICVCVAWSNARSAVCFLHLPSLTRESLLPVSETLAGRRQGGSSCFVLWLVREVFGHVQVRLSSFRCQHVTELVSRAHPKQACSQYWCHKSPHVSFVPGRSPKQPLLLSLLSPLICTLRTLRPQAVPSDDWFFFQQGTLWPSQRSTKRLANCFFYEFCVSCNAQENWFCKGKFKYRILITVFCPMGRGDKREDEEKGHHPQGKGTVGHSLVTVSSDALSQASAASDGWECKWKREHEPEDLTNRTFTCEYITCNLKAKCKYNSKFNSEFMDIQL